MVVPVVRTALLAAVAVVLGVGSASASVVGSSGLVPLDITGTYTSLPKSPPSPDPFPTTSFDFSVLLPATMDVNFRSSGGVDTYTYTGLAAGTYTDGGVNAAFTDALVVFTEAQAAASIGTQGSGLGAGKIVLPTVKFSISNLLTKGDRLTVLAELAAPEWTLSNPGAKGTLSLDSGSWTVPHGDVTYSRKAIASIPLDPPFKGQLSVPEPASMAIFATGLVLLLGVARRRALD